DPAGAAHRPDGRKYARDPSGSPATRPARGCRAPVLFSAPYASNLAPIQRKGQALSPHNMRRLKPYSPLRYDHLRACKIRCTTLSCAPIAYKFEANPRWKACRTTQIDFVKSWPNELPRKVVKIGKSSMYFKTSEVAGLRIFYREAGDPAKPNIVLLHGFP